MKIHHLNCGVLHAPPNPKASCHCLLLELHNRLVLIDTGIGLQDIARPAERIGQEAIEAAGFQFHEELTASRQIKKLGFQSSDVTDIVLTHCDYDHVGGLADFPKARVHVSNEEFLQLGSDSERYSSAQFAHAPDWVQHSSSSTQWFGLEARPLNIFEEQVIHLVPLFGHTLGHCGVAIQQDERWLFHVGDAYYLRVELSDEEHPVCQLASLAAMDDELRRRSLSQLRDLLAEHGDVLELVGYHDFTEFPDYYVRSGRHVSLEKPGGR